MSEPKRVPVRDFDDGQSIDELVRQAVRRAIARNKALGNPLPEQVGDEIRVVPAKDLPDPEPEG